jgi:hypothetical protein
VIGIQQIAAPITGHHPSIADPYAPVAAAPEAQLPTVIVGRGKRIVVVAPEAEHLAAPKVMPAGVPVIAASCGLAVDASSPPSAAALNARSAAFYKTTASAAFYQATASWAVLPKALATPHDAGAARASTSAAAGRDQGRTAAVGAPSVATAASAAARGTRRNATASTSAAARSTRKATVSTTG